MSNNSNILNQPNVIPIESIPVISIPFENFKLIDLQSIYRNESSLLPINQFLPNILNRGIIEELTQDDFEYLSNYIDEFIRIRNLSNPDNLQSLIEFVLSATKSGVKDHQDDVQTPQRVSELISLDVSLRPNTKCNLFNYAFKLLFEVSIERFLPNPKNKVFLCLSSSDFARDILSWGLKDVSIGNIPHSHLVLITSYGKNSINSTVLDPYHVIDLPLDKINQKIDKTSIRPLDGIMGILDNLIVQTETLSLPELTVDEIEANQSHERKIERLISVARDNAEKQIKFIKNLNLNDLTSIEDIETALNEEINNILRRKPLTSSYSLKRLQSTFIEFFKQRFSNPFFGYTLINLINKDPDVISENELLYIIEKYQKYLLEEDDFIISAMQKLEDKLQTDNTIDASLYGSRIFNTKKAMYQIQYYNFKKREGLKLLEAYYKKIYRKDLESVNT